LLASTVFTLFASPITEPAAAISPVMLVRSLINHTVHQILRESKRAGG
jgi:hypothetical protein